MSTGRKRKVLVLPAVLVLLFLCFSLSFAFAELSVEGLNTIRIRGKGTVDRKGALHLDLAWEIPTNALYIEIKRNFPNPYVILREFASHRAAFEVATARIEYDDAERALNLAADFWGAAVNRRGRWEVDLGKGADCIWIEKQTAVFLEIMHVASQLIQVMDVIIELPGEASNLKYDENKGVLAYSLPEELATGYCELDLSLKCKPRLTAATYKAYANPDISEGDMWVAKAIFKNTGECSIRDLKVNYKLGEYADWSIPKSYSLIVPGGCVVDLYYPVISSKVTELLTRTPVDVRMKYEFRDQEGNIYSDVTGERIEILGINQMEFCNLSMEEITGTWVEYFSNSPLLAAWVTHLDSPVKAVAGMVSRLAGGVPSSLDRESAIKFCRALYDLEVANGMAYQTPSGFLRDYTPGQDIKYPRDVLRDKSGTCVDLAILYASVCEAVGLKTLLITLPGHCFPVIYLPDGELLPVECTGISGAAVGVPAVKALSFDQTVEFGFKQLSELKMGMHYVVDVREMQQKGVVSPELPRLEGDILERWGWRLTPEFSRGAEEGETIAGTEDANTYSSEEHKLSFVYPGGWKVQEEEGVVHVIHPQTLAWITMLRTVQDFDPQSFLQNVEAHLKQQYQDFAVTGRKQVVVNGVDALRVDAQSTSPEGGVLIHTLLLLYENNLAKVLAACDVLREQQLNLYPIVEQVFNSITLLNE